MSGPDSSADTRPTLPLPPLPGEERAGRHRMTFPLACVTTICMVLAAMVLQHLWINFQSLIGDAREGAGLVPLVALCGAGLLVAVVVLVLLLKHVRRLLVSLRMIAAVLLMLALLLSASRILGPQGLMAESPESAPTPASAPAAAPGGRKARTAGQYIGERAMLVVRTANLADPGESWAVIALVIFLGAGSAAALVWRRPVGSREFAFMAVHLGLLTLLCGLGARHLLGRSLELRLVCGATAKPVTARGSDEPDLKLRMVRAEIAERTPDIQLLVARGPDGPREALPLDVRRGGEAVWRGLTVSVLEVRDAAAPELYLDNIPGSASVPTVKISLTAPTEGREFMVSEGTAFMEAREAYGVVLTYERRASAGEAEAACRREEQLDPEWLAVAGPDGKVRDRVQLPPGARTAGFEFDLGDVRLKVQRKFFSRQAPAVPGGAQPAPAEDVPVLELAPVGPGADPKAIFRVAAGQTPVAPDGQAPAELAGLQLLYSAKPIANVVRLVEGPEGTFHLAEVEQGRPTKVEAIQAGVDVQLAGGSRFRLLESIPQAQTAYRPAADAHAAPGRPAVHLRASPAGGAPAVDFWLFPGFSPAREVGGALLSARLVHRGLSRAAAVIEVYGERGSLGEYPLAMGRPLELEGWQLTLRELHGIDASSPTIATAAVLSADRDPAIWAIYAGMLLVALGTPWLLWSRLRRVSEMPVRED